MMKWQLFNILRRKIAEQEETIRHLTSQLDIAMTLAQCGGEFGRAIKGKLQGIQDAIMGVDAGVRNLTQGQRKFEDRIMATLQDLKNELDTQNKAILTEIAEIEVAMAELKADPAKLDEIVSGIRANTAAVAGIIKKPLPEPDPVPNPVP